MLQNAYFLAKIGADTAENEQHFAEILPKIGGPAPGLRDHALRRDGRGVPDALALLAAVLAQARPPHDVVEASDLTRCMQTYVYSNSKLERIFSNF